MDDEDAAKRVRGNVDRLSELPDNLLCQILLNNPTKDVVKSSVLSQRWRNLWRHVPGLSLEPGDFPEYEAYVSFVDSFLGYNNSESRLQKFKIKDKSLDRKHDWDWDYSHGDDVARWIDAIVKRRVQHLHVGDSTGEVDKQAEIPSTVYNCESLVSLKLFSVSLANPKSVSFSCVKVMNLGNVRFVSDCAFEMLILGSPVLERLIVSRSPHDNVKVLRVCSQSLLSFTHMGHDVDFVEEELVVVVDAPRLEKLQLYDQGTDSFVVKNLGSLVKVGLCVVFNLSSEKRFDPDDVPKRSMIRSFLVGISSVRDMSISSDTLEMIYNYSRCERVPLLRNITTLSARFTDYRWEMLPVFLESCPNLKSLSLRFSKSPWEQPDSIEPVARPHGFLPSLEYVEIEQPMVDEVAEVELLSYFLEKSRILKKLTLFVFSSRENESSLVFLKKLLAIPRLSTSCQVVFSDPPSFW
ncbi:unnamed protein product [Microthlaspi erraticum]|uniref:F-box domain-containing protein n=1 Tax=Microthlaspi erraticum TaxID=1685480 RepID=A0A6D2K5D5_9BRAS|nr:unnamed protein product [Microthlaspi erraticum]